MPALPNVPKVLRVALKGNIGGGEKWLTRFYIQYQASAPTPPNLVTFNNGVAAAFQAHMPIAMTTNRGLQEIETTDLSSPTNSEAITNETIVGTNAGVPLPNVSAAVASYTILRRYRGGHPRGYWPLGQEADMTSDGKWSASSLQTFHDSVSLFFNDVVAINWGTQEGLVHVNVSYYEGFTVVIDPITGRARNVPKLRSSGPLVDGVVGIVINPELGTQRRRGQF